MSKEKVPHKMPFENRLIRFVVFDVLLGLKYSELGFPEWIYTIAGGIAIYLLLTVISGYGIFHSIWVWIKNKS